MVSVAELAGVSVRRGTTLLLDDVNLSIDEGQRWVVIGPNGAGKTTLLSILATHLYPTKGVVGILGEVLGAVDVFELRPRIGLTSPTVAHRIPARERVRDVVVSASYAVNGRWREHYDEMDFDRAGRLMDYFGVVELADRTYGTLSEGERKRVEIARAMMTDPELLLLDEPGAGLDLGGRERLVSTLAQLCASPYAPTTVLVTHHVEEIPAGITHALLLSGGRVAASGPIGEVLTDELMSAVYGMPLRIEQADDGRWTAKAAC
ncbi:ABC transporter ATP-binding protein [Propionibacterium acidifaciens]|uniref:ABC transporter, ATP-binding protein n=1 Tax=Propionibacterium acidifaciens F0233 TaxID=553198 RepID=U2RE70_9ACTN|nr:ABC transporter ATP-binding protein [Propionibacterium acidifaciens]AYW78391.1 ABC transporter ATP-binding protein [Propionibacterium acidifaciens]ERK51863.1 ABC transporter, ATP-binding protein [Propionibacterium acidifaciens F0233]